MRCVIEWTSCRPCILKIFRRSLYGIVGSFFVYNFSLIIPSEFFNIDDIPDGILPARGEDERSDSDESDSIGNMYCSLQLR